jgi:hypothetical protein
MKKKLTILKKLDPKVMAISIYDLDSMKHVMKLLNKIKEEKEV